MIIAPFRAMTRREGTFAAALCVTSAALVAALKPVCIHETGDALDECLGALCRPTSMTGLQGYGACWENGKYKWAETGYYNRGDACGTTAKDFMCHRCPVGFNTYAAKCEMRDLHSAALHHQVGELAEGTELLESMPEPMCAA